jgi:hypothetical protein
MTKVGRCAFRAALRPYGLSQLHCLRQSPLPLSQGDTQ